MENKQNEHILSSHMKLYSALDSLFSKGITVLSTRCFGSLPVIQVQAHNAAVLDGGVVVSRVVDGNRVNEYHAIFGGCLVVWENVYVH